MAKQNKSEVGDAVIGLETDCGLIFIEPQDGETIDIAAGKSLLNTG